MAKHNLAKLKWPNSSGQTQLGQTQLGQTQLAKLNLAILKLAKHMKKRNKETHHKQGNFSPKQPVIKKTSSPLKSQPTSLLADSTSSPLQIPAHSTSSTFSYTPTQLQEDFYREENFQSDRLRQ